MSLEMITASYDLNVLSGSIMREYDKSARNMNVINHISMRQSMQNTTYTQFATEVKGIEVVLEFPCCTSDEAIIHEEVKQILSNLLQEHINQIT